MSYVVLGTNNMNAAIEFYSSLFKGIEVSQILRTDRMNCWIFDNISSALAIPRL